MSASGSGALFPPPDSAISLYSGEVMHARLKPIAHRFNYRVFSILIDLGRLDEAARASPLFSVNRFNLLSFHEADHGPGGNGADGSRLIERVASALEPSGLSLEGRRVLLLCYPRVAGLVFNPLSVYFVYDARDALRAMIYEVRNTFGERHSYVAPLAPGELSAAGLRQERAKLFYVSPFNGMDMRYHFRILPPGDRIAVRILESDHDGPLLAATFSGERRDMTTAALLRAMRRAPLLTAKVVGGIHLEALRLWRKGLAIKPRPSPPEPLSYGDASTMARRAP